MSQSQSSARSKIGALALIGLVVAGGAAAFAYTAGWFSPQRLTSEPAFDPSRGIVKVFVLNLDRQPARWNRIAEAVRHIQIGRGGSLRELCERESAVDAECGPYFAADRDSIAR